MTSKACKAPKASGVADAPAAPAVDKFINGEALREGDIVLGRSYGMLGAAFAVGGAVRGAYSHAVMYFRDAEGRGRFFNYRPTGMESAEPEDFFSRYNRLALVRPRFAVDGARLSAEARAWLARDAARKIMPDYNLNMEDHGEFFCLETTIVCYRGAGYANPFTQTTRMDAASIGRQVRRIFKLSIEGIPSPGAVLLNPDFELLSEWTRPEFDFRVEAVNEALIERLAEYLAAGYWPCRPSLGGRIQLRLLFGAFHVVNAFRPGRRHLEIPDFADREVRYNGYTLFQLGNRAKNDAKAELEKMPPWSGDSRPGLHSPDVRRMARSMVDRYSDRFLFRLDNAEGADAAGCPAPSRCAKCGKPMLSPRRTAACATKNAGVCSPRASRDSRAPVAAGGGAVPLTAADYLPSAPPAPSAAPAAPSAPFIAPPIATPAVAPVVTTTPVISTPVVVTPVVSTPTPVASAPATITPVRPAPRREPHRGEFPDLTALTELPPGLGIVFVDGPPVAATATVAPPSPATLPAPSLSTAATRDTGRPADLPAAVVVATPVAAPVVESDAAAGDPLLSLLEVDSPSRERGAAVAVSVDPLDAPEMDDHPIPGIVRPEALREARDQASIDRESVEPPVPILPSINWEPISPPENPEGTAAAEAEGKNPAAAMPPALPETESSPTTPPPLQPPLPPLPAPVQGEAPAPLPDAAANADDNADVNTPPPSAMVQDGSVGTGSPANADTDLDMDTESAAATHPFMPWPTMPAQDASAAKEKIIGAVDVDVDAVDGDTDAPKAIGAPLPPPPALPVTTTTGVETVDGADEDAAEVPVATINAAPAAPAAAMTTVAAMDFPPNFPPGIMSRRQARTVDNHAVWRLRERDTRARVRPEPGRVLYAMTPVRAGAGEHPGLVPAAAAPAASAVPVAPSSRSGREDGAPAAVNTGNRRGSWLDEPFREAAVPPHPAPTEQRVARTLPTGSEPPGTEPLAARPAPAPAVPRGRWLDGGFTPPPPAVGGATSVSTSTSTSASAAVSSSPKGADDFGSPLAAASSAPSPRRSWLDGGGETPYDTAVGAYSAGMDQGKRMKNG